MDKAGSIVVFLSDTHIGSTTAIAPPEFTTHTGRKNETQTNQHNIYQKWLWACWKDFIEYTKHLAGIVGNSRKSRLVVCHLGDVVDGEHHGTRQIMPEVSDQYAAAEQVLGELFALADARYITYGTPAHNGGTAEFEVDIAGRLQAEHDWMFLLNIDGITFDIAHHGRAGKRDQTSAAAGVGAEVAADYLADGMPVPNYIIRGHQHKIDDSGIKLPYTRVIQLPSWQLRTVFGQKIAENQRRSDIGGMFVNTALPQFPILDRMRYTAPRGLIRRMVTI